MKNTLSWPLYVLCALLLAACSADSGGRFAAASSSSQQSRKDGVFLAACTLEPGRVMLGGEALLDVQEAFIERRFGVTKMSDDIALTDSVNLDAQLVIVTRAGSRLGGSATEATLELREAPFAEVAQRGRHVFTLDLTPQQLGRPLALRLETRDAQGRYRSYNLLVRPQPALQPAAAAPAVRPLGPPARPEAALPTATAGVEEHFAFYNTSAAASRRAGMLRAAYAVAPGVVEAGGLRLDVQEAFIEQHALLNSLSRRVELDSTNLVGPRLVLVCRPGSRLPRLGIDWDLRLAGDPHNLAYQVEQHDNLLLFHVAPRYVGRAFDLVATIPGAPRPLPLRLRPMPASTAESR